MMYRCPASPLVIAATALSATLCESLPSGFRAGGLAEHQQHSVSQPATESREQMSDPTSSTPSLALYFWLKLRLVTQLSRSVYA